MTIRNIDKLIGLTSHPLESHFDLPAESTEIVISKRSTIPAEYKLYDEKDKEIEEDYQMVADAALDVADLLKEHIDSKAIEAKFIPRLAEVLGQQLGIALSAIDKKAKLKDNKDKFDLRKSTVGKGNVTNNNTIIMNRNDMLNLMMQKSQAADAEIISGECMALPPEDIDDSIDGVESFNITKEPNEE